MRILLIEDDAVLGMAVRDQMAADGHSVDWMKRLDDAGRRDPRGRLRPRAPRPDAARRARPRLPQGAARGGRRDARHHPDRPRPDLRPHRGAERRRRRLSRQAVRPLRALGPRQRRRPPLFRQSQPARHHRRPRGGPRRPLGAAGRQARAADGAGVVAVRGLRAAAPTLLSKAQLEERLYSFDTEIESNTIEVHIARLRKKIGADMIETVRGMGYRLGTPGAGRVTRGTALAQPAPAARHRPRPRRGGALAGRGAVVAGPAARAGDRRGLRQRAAGGGPAHPAARLFGAAVARRGRRRPAHAARRAAPRIHHLRRARRRGAGAAAVERRRPR